MLLCVGCVLWCDLFLIITYNQQGREEYAEAKSFIETYTVKRKGFVILRKGILFLITLSQMVLSIGLKDESKMESLVMDFGL